MLIKTEVKEEVKVEQTDVKEQNGVPEEACEPHRLGQHIEAKLEKESAR